MKRLFAQRCYMVNVYGFWLLLAAAHIGNATTAELESFIAMEKAA